MSDTATLLVWCPDQRGLVAAISDFVFRNGGNILHADQHTDIEAGMFLARVEWELEGFEIPRERIGERFRNVACNFGMNFELFFSDRPSKLAIFTSKLPHCLQDLLLRREAGELQADFALIVSNHPDHREIAEAHGIEFLHFPITPENKARQEAAELAALRERGIELVVLARYMQILSPAFVAEFPNQMINIHHSFLPAFVGAQPYHQAYQRGVKLIGATSHYVTTVLDDGPIIEQEVTRISHRDTVEDLIRKGRDLEKMVLARAVRLHLRHRVLTYGNKTVIFD
ncbi:MAG: formyltetrahydrofolate deformylase [Acidobacteria bacterium]|nr:formyltetrahydrofolate deformylase [Acidobacteriota bacterium]